MFNFSTFISLFVAIIAIYIPLYFTFKKELDDLETNENSNKEKITNREEKITKLKIVCFILAVVVIVLYQFPAIISIVKNVKPPKIKIPNALDFFSSLFPFNKDFFAEANFKFSYITGIICSIIVIIVGLAFYIETVIPTEFIEYLLGVIMTIVLIYCLIWLNNFISLFLVHCITHYFELLSIILNIVAYILIEIVLFIVITVGDSL